MIIGPNGSGKSNLVDAVRWVFGEQNTALLRARAGADLAFRGRPGPGIAGCRVTAVLGAVPTLGAVDPGSNDGSPLAISRSLGADGSENYVIGEKPLERSEFLRVLRRRGVEAPLRTVIGQGEVGRLLWLHPGERTRLLAQTVGASLQAANHDEYEERARARLDQEGARLLLACAPRADDPLLRSTLAALGMAFPRGEDVTLEEAVHAVKVRITGLENSRADRPARPVHGRAPESFAAQERSPAFLELHSRVEERFDTLFRTLTPGGSAALPLVQAEPGAELPGLDVAVHFPRRPAVPLDGLSGGQLTQVGLCLALAVFLEVSFSPLVLDEVEPALDEALLRRLTRLFAEVSRERQIIAVTWERSKWSATCRSSRPAGTASPLCEGTRSDPRDRLGGVVSSVRSRVPSSEFRRLVHCRTGR
ncbi:MAG: hypothetical protein M5U22_18795 [Thermoleophilia bacterium]|nr:hypothetical protein [Thermoleophilia bacterium]